MKIKKILTSQAIPGMICAGDIYTFNNLLIIAMNTPLTDRIITRLRFYSIEEIPVFIEEAKPIVHEEYVDPVYEYTEINTNKIKKTIAFKKFHKSYIETVDNLNDSLTKIASHSGEINIDELMLHCNDVLLTCRNTFHVFDMLHCIRDYDDLTFVHSLNVALICNTIGKWLDFSKEDLDALTLAGLLHDIGKLLIPNSIISKSGKLTDDEFTTIKTHSTKGYQLLKDMDIDKRIKYAALMHHERCDGSGYPNGYTRRSIDSFAKIVAIADVFDAMTSARAYRGPLCPFEVISLFETEGLNKYDPKYLMTFLEGIVQTYMHNQVRLSNGMEGEIIMINKNFLSKPIVHVEYAFIDLSKEKDLSIVAIL